PGIDLLLDRPGRIGIEVQVYDPSAAGASGHGASQYPTVTGLPRPGQSSPIDRTSCRTVTRAARRAERGSSRIRKFLYPPSWPGRQPMIEIRTAETPDEI